MKNKILIIILFLLGGLALLTVGGYAGILIEAQKTAPQLEILSKWQNLVESKVVSSSNIVVVGEVIKISDRKITLTSEGESLEIPIKEGVYVYTFDYSKTIGEEEVLFKPKAINFEEINVGDIASIIIVINQAGEFEGVEIRVFPPI